MHVFFLQRYERTVGGIGATFGLQFATENVSVFWLTVIDTNIIHTHTHTMAHRMKAAMRQKQIACTLPRPLLKRFSPNGV